jgi:hypothetical protein
MSERPGGESRLPVWENLQDGAGVRYARRLPLLTGGWLYQPSTPAQVASVPGFTFVPDMSQILMGLQAISNVLNSVAMQTPAPDPDPTTSLHVRRPHGE